MSSNVGVYSEATVPQQKRRLCVKEKILYALELGFGDQNCEVIGHGVVIQVGHDVFYPQVGICQVGGIRATVLATGMLVHM